MEVSKKSGLAEAICYALSHWEGLTRFLKDGRIEIDNNAVERNIRPLDLAKRTWSILASLLNTARLNEIDPQEYLTDVLERIVSGRTKINQLPELLPWEWKAERQASCLRAAA
jgi:hypothetical protein